MVTFASIGAPALEGFGKMVGLSSLSGPTTVMGAVATDSIVRSTVPHCRSKLERTVRSVMPDAVALASKSTEAPVVRLSLPRTGFPSNPHAEAFARGEQFAGTPDQTAEKFVEFPVFSNQEAGSISRRGDEFPKGIARTIRGGPEGFADIGGTMLEPTRVATTAKPSKHPRIRASKLTIRWFGWKVGRGELATESLDAIPVFATNSFGESWKMLRSTVDVKGYVFPGKRLESDGGIDPKAVAFELRTRFRHDRFGGPALRHRSDLQYEDSTPRVTEACRRVLGEDLYLPTLGDVLIQEIDESHVGRVPLRKLGVRENREEVRTVPRQCEERSEDYGTFLDHENLTVGKKIAEMTRRRSMGPAQIQNGSDPLEIPGVGVPQQKRRQFRSKRVPLAVLDSGLPAKLLVVDTFSRGEVDRVQVFPSPKDSGPGCAVHGL